MRGKGRDYGCAPAVCRRLAFPSGFAASRRLRSPTLRFPPPPPLAPRWGKRIRSASGSPAAPLLPASTLTGRLGTEASRHPFRARGAGVKKRKGNGRKR
ncbi:hypothetical protein chiPu_0022711 [Chiloscyllium punctatum]|uniref:Uncharacterized protein n=1 Tax=Chiloscyllium punctatum TaxID=137246 RepID=A0A401T8V4_CHIPU|nr:hypothetical protein [Chiloscyllium punctatum]